MKARERCFSPWPVVRAVFTCCLAPSVRKDQSLRYTLRLARKARNQDTATSLDSQSRCPHQAGCVIELSTRIVRQLASMSIWISALGLRANDWWQCVHGFSGSIVPQNAVKYLGTSPGLCSPEFCKYVAEMRGHQRPRVFATRYPSLLRLLRDYLVIGF